MALEIERKFLVADNSFAGMASSATRIRQGYISRNADATVRVRTAGRHATLTIKSRNDGCARSEFEYEIPLADGESLLALCPGPIITKTRHVVDFEGFRWEVDVFGGDLEGVVVAEIELPSPETQFPLPPFVGKEVTGDPLYYNSNIHKLANRSRRLPD